MWTGKPKCDCRRLNITMARMAMYVRNVPPKRVRATNLDVEMQ